MTKVSDELYTELEQELFDIRRSVRYHMHRTRFYDFWHNAATAGTAILGLSAVGTLLANSHTVALWLAASISVLGILDLVIGTPRKARLHQTLAARFVALESGIVGGGVGLTEAQRQRLAIEMEEPPVLRVLDTLCHNEMLRAMGHPVSEQVKVGFFQRLFSPLFDLVPHTLIPPVEH